MLLWPWGTPSAARGMALLPPEFLQCLWPQARLPQPSLLILLCGPMGKGLPITCPPRHSPSHPSSSPFPLCPYPILVPFPCSQHPSLSPHIPSPGTGLLFHPKLPVPCSPSQAPPVPPLSPRAPSSSPHIPVPLPYGSRLRWGPGTLPCPSALPMATPTAPGVTGYQADP